ncbi:ATP-dependent protease ATPase subunit HslU [Rosistilla oblonga]|uniref:ATP-dependent protease ATPase subunit HslU n=1 Tax=Rosistilla oblonga TaxID=2527990 RepID=UPI003A9803A4
MSDSHNVVDALGKLTPAETVKQLDRYIVGQRQAKRAVAVALRNRWRRQQLSEEMQGEIAPKNILMIGPTGVGKTEIARRLARMTGAPFIKVEATKYTEVGYYGRDVESMVRELVENGLGLVREKFQDQVREEAEQRVENRLVDLLVPGSTELPSLSQALEESATETADEAEQRLQRTRDKMRKMLQAGTLEERTVEVTTQSKSAPMVVGGMGMENMDIDLQGMFEKIMPRGSQSREMKVNEARQVLMEQETEALLDPEAMNAEAIRLAEELGIIFVDEIDKVIATDGKNADVSRQGVQRDLLPIVEGTSVQTRYGYVRTDHILFIAAGAFHRGKPSELMPELQGRFPIRVELDELTEHDFLQILTEPKNSLTRQYEALLATEQVTIEFQQDALAQLARYAFKVNQSTQNIGARRLYTIMERLLEELSFEAPELGKSSVKIDAAYVEQRLNEIAEDEDLSKFIL